MSQKITYKCKSCGWTASVVAEWADQKPNRCLGKRCKTSFIKSPDKLATIMPKTQIMEEYKEDDTDGE